MLRGKVFMVSLYIKGSQKANNLQRIEERQRKKEKEKDNQDI